MTGTTDPFSASIIPFEVPEQMRAFAEKGVSQAREGYARFKDAAESHNGAVEAMFIAPAARWHFKQDACSPYNGRA